MRIPSRVILAWTHTACLTETGKFERASSRTVSRARTNVELLLAYRYWTLSKRLIPGPYIRSRRSNKVVSRVRGGRKPERLDDFFFGGLLEFSGLSAAGTVISSAMATSPYIDPDPDSELVSEVDSVASSCPSSVEEALLSSGLESFVDATSLSDPFLRCCFSDNFACLFFFSCLSKDKIVGGSCMGSPARINLLALNMGTQHT